MTHPSRRSVLARLLSVPVVGALVGATKLDAVAPGVKSDEAWAYQEAGMQVMRFLNTLQHWHKETHKQFATLTQLGASDALQLLTSSASTMKKLGLTSAMVTKMRFEDGKEIIPGWKVTLVLRNGRTGYWISLEDLSDTVGLLTTDDQGVIQSQGSEAGSYQLPAGAHAPRRFARTTAMLKTVALPGGLRFGDCGSDHRCDCGCECSQTFTLGATNCGCVACTWCPACT